MEKAKVEKSGVKRKIGRVRSSARACVGVMCAALLLVGAMPTASGAFGEDAPEGTGAPEATETVPCVLAAGNPTKEGPAPEPAFDAGAQEDPEDGPEAAPLPDGDSDAEGDPVPGGDAQNDLEVPGLGTPEDPCAVQRGLGAAEAVPVPATAEEGPLSAAPRAGTDPAGFSWKYADIGDTNTCKIVGYNDKVITSGTVHVPARNPVNNKKVVALEGARNSSGVEVGYTYQNLKCGIDFSSATNLERIGNRAFQGSGLSGVINFSGCTSLEKIETQAFQDSSGVTSVVLPPNIVKIVSYAFAGCTGITGPLTLPKSLEVLGESVFDGCKLTRLSIPSDIALTSIPKYAFRNNSLTGKIVFPSQITSFGSFAFGGDDDSKNSLTSVEFQATGLLSVGASAFKNNQIANDPITGKSFSMLGEFAFANNNLSRKISFEGDWSGYPGNGIIAGNEMVEEVVLSPHWLLVPDRMFDGVSHLKSVQFPTGEKKISHIGSQAFRGCTGIEEIDFKDAPLADSEPNSIAIGASAFEGCTSLRAVHVGNGVFGSQSRVTLTIGDSAFKGCTALSFIDIPEPTSGVTTFSVNIGNRAFMDTNLGAFPGPDNTALGFLPFDRRRVLSIGASAFENAGLKGVTLPDTLGSVGDRAFAGNHMTNLELPRNKSLDEPGKVGSDILADQTVKTPAVWGDSIKGGPGKADIILEALHGLGVVHGRVDSVSLNVPNTAGGFDHLTPENSETWPEDDRATYDRGLVTTPSATFTYGYQVWREGGERALSHGTVTQGSVKKGIPFEFYYYDNEEFSGTPDTHTQWVGEDFFPVENMHGLGNFGLEKPGYRTFPGAYEPRYNAGWRDGSGPGDTGQPVDPEIIPAVDGQKPKFYNRWIANSYSVSFDDNWEEMVAKSPELGKDDGSGTIVRNDRWVSGSTANMTGLVYGESAPLPENGFKMGAYVFDGWATSPDLAEGDRMEGSNFFSPGASIATPSPAPAHEATLVLYAQWKAVDYGADDPALLGFLSIPQHISLEPHGGYLYSKPTDPAADADNHAVVVSAKEEGPGATWPSGTSYKVSVVRPGAGAPLLALSGDGGDAKEIDVLMADGSLYDPGPNGILGSGAVPDPLMVIDPHDDARSKGSFSLKSVDPASSFMANVRYAGTMTFRVDAVQTGVAP